MNQRVQDGAKEYWLCSQCEGRFNEWETKFSNSIFHPANSGDFPTISYGDWLLRFCTSISWRALVYLQQQDGFGVSLSENQRRLIVLAKDTWAKFLRDEIPHPDVFEQHLMPFGPVKDGLAIDFPPNVNRYLLRTTEINFGRGNSTAFVYSKFGQFAVLGFVQLSRPKQWIGTKIRLRGGVLKPREYILPVEFGEFLAERAARTWKIMDDISDTQSKRIEETLRADLDKFANSDFFKALQFDVERSGRAAFRK